MTTKRNRPAFCVMPNMLWEVSPLRLLGRLLAITFAHHMAIEALKHLERERLAFVFRFCRHHRALGILAPQPVHDRFDIGPPLISIGIHSHSSCIKNMIFYDTSCI